DARAWHCGVVLADEDFARIEYLADDEPFHVCKAQAATSVAILTIAPLRKLVLDIVVDALVEVVTSGLHLRLQANSATDDVIHGNRAGALGIGRITTQRTGAGAQLNE